MTVTVPRPKLLITVVLIVLIAGVVYSVAAGQETQDPPLEYIPLGPNSELPTVTADEVDRALETLAVHPVFVELTNQSGWHIAAQLPATDGGRKVGVALVIEFEEPVDSDGPWTTAFCRNTKLVTSPFPYIDVTTIGVAFADDGATLTTIAPLLTSPETTLGADPDDPAYAPPECPEGFEDEEQ